LVIVPAGYFIPAGYSTAVDFDAKENCVKADRNNREEGYYAEETHYAKDFYAKDFYAEDLQPA
jgi:hypothetical protein